MDFKFRQSNSGVTILAAHGRDQPYSPSPTVIDDKTDNDLRDVEYVPSGGGKWYVQIETESSTPLTLSDPMTPQNATVKCAEPAPTKCNLMRP